MVSGRIGARQQHLGYGNGRIGVLGTLSILSLQRSDAVRVSNFQTRDGTYSNSNSSGTPPHLPCTFYLS